MQKNSSVRKHVMIGTVALGGLLGVWVGVGSAQSAESAACPQGNRDIMAIAKLIRGPDLGTPNCVSCHTKEEDVWRNTRHYKSFLLLEDQENAQEMVDALEEAGISTGTWMSDPTVGNLCLQCHYTVTMDGEDLDPHWGVTCESCHGPAKNWLKGHSPSGFKNYESHKREDKTVRNARLEKAAKQGMIHSQMIYEIAKNCYGCHTVPNEGLVNNSTHRPGSIDFDLVAWSQGEVRHNFASSPGAPENPTNAVASKKRLRQLYVVGALVDLEVSICNLLAVKETGGAFHIAMIARVKKARDKVSAIEVKTKMAGLAEILAKVPDPDNIPEDVPALISKLAKGVVEDTDLAAVDELIPPPSEYRGEIHKD